MGIGSSSSSLTVIKLFPSCSLTSDFTFKLPLTVVLSLVNLKDYQGNIWDDWGTKRDHLPFYDSLTLSFSFSKDYADMFN